MLCLRSVCCYILPLPLHPHLNPGAEHLGPDGVDTVFFLENFRRGQAVQNGLDGWAGVGELHRLQLSAVHELHPFPKFALLKPGGIGRRKPLVRNTEGLDAEMVGYWSLGLEKASLRSMPRI